MAEFPILFGDKKYISLWVGQGWFEILWDLCVSVEGIARSRVAAGQHPIRIVQVKEKYGTLRVYVEGGCQEVYDLIDAAETRSESICETCGKPGNLMEIRGWWQTVCPSHELMALLPSRAHFDISTGGDNPLRPSWCCVPPTQFTQPRDTKLYLRDILEAVSEITTYIAGMDRQAFEQHELLRDAVLWQVGVIGTASRQVPLDLIGPTPSPSWEQARRLRDHPAAECFGLDEESLWRAIKEGLPLLACEVAALLKAIDP